MTRWIIWSGGPAQRSWFEMVSRLGPSARTIDWRSRMPGSRTRLTVIGRNGQAGAVIEDLADGAPASPDKGAGRVADKV